jgi:CheY-like chemotaxis protein
MGGTIGFDSQVGSGSTFWFAIAVSVGATGSGVEGTLATSEQPAPVSPAAASLEATQLLGCVLVVEDNPVNQLVAEGVVGSLGYQVEIVTNGVEALQALHHGDYMAVLMDCHMPVMDGFQATREIRRRQGAGVRVPVIAMTASAMSEDRQRCLDAGMDDFVTKPVSPEAIRAALGRVLLLDPVPASAPFPESPLDHERVCALRQLGTLSKGPDLLWRLTELYAHDSPLSLAAIRQAVTSHDPTELAQALHKLVGTSANIGARRVVDVCRSFEQQVPDLDADRGAQLVAELEVEISRANEALGDALQQP